MNLGSVRFYISLTLLWTWVLFLPSPSYAASLTLKSVADTTLFENDPGNNLGSTTLAAGTTVANRKSRALVRFNLGTNIPINAIITNVQVTVTVTMQPNRNVRSSSFDLRRMQVSWIEGTKGSPRGSPATAGEPTWNERAKGSGAWGTPGASEGADFAAQASASTPVAAVGAKMNFLSSASLIADVQLWLTNSGANFGWMLISQAESTLGTARRFGSRESGILQQPSLVIGYTVPVTATPPTITTHPKSQTGYAGETVTLSVTATGEGALAYQWARNATDVSGAISPSLSLPNFQAANAGDYTVKVSNAGGSITSSTAALTFVAAPKIDGITIGSGGAAISFMAFPRHTFTIEAIDQFGLAAWSAVASQAATNTVSVMTLTAPATASKRFYRLSVQPLP